MARYAYMDVAQLSGQIQTPAAYEADLLRCLEAASVRVDQFCGRTFVVYDAVRVFDSDCRDDLDLPTGADLLIITELATLSAYNGTTRVYGNVWSVDDYDLSPFDAPLGYEPYSCIERRPYGAYWFPFGLYGRRGVRITGRWGYWEQWDTLAAVLSDDMDDATTDLPLDSVAEIALGQTLQVGAEQMYVVGPIESGVAGVVRAVNGTTAAAHATDDPVQLFRAPEGIARATGMLAAQMFNRGRNSPGGTAGVSEFGVMQPMRMSPEIKDLLEPYRVVTV